MTVVRDGDRGGVVTEFWFKRYRLVIFILYASQVRCLMWTARGDVMRSRNLVLIVAVLVMVVALAACSSAGQSSGDQGQVPQKKATQKKVTQEQPKKKETAEKQEPAKKMTDEARASRSPRRRGQRRMPETEKTWSSLRRSSVSSSRSRR